jgi:hypothetical protein
MNDMIIIENTEDKMMRQMALLGEIKQSCAMHLKKYIS